MALPPSTAWAPASDRTLELRTVGGARPSLAFPAKAPAEALDFSIQLMPGIVDAWDSIAALSVTASPSDLTVQATSLNGTVGTAWLSGGTVGITYALTFSFTLNSGRDVETVAALLVAVASGGTVQTSGVITPATLAAVLSRFPTSPVGVAAGAWWIDGGSLKQVQL